MVRLRLKRFGRRHVPVYRLNAIDMRSPRDGKPIEELGYYDPRQADFEKSFRCDSERVKYWLGVGAQPSETVASLLRKAGLLEAKPARGTASSQAQA